MLTLFMCLPLKREWGIWDGGVFVRVQDHDGTKPVWKLGKRAM